MEEPDEEEGKDMMRNYRCKTVKWSYICNLYIKSNFKALYICGRSLVA